MLGRVRDLNRLELAGETVRAALEALAAAAPGWLAGVIDASWQEAYGQRIDGMRLPASEAKRADLAVQYGRDGYRLLEAVRGPGAPAWLRELPAVEALRRIWVQQYYRDTARGAEGDLAGGPSRASRRADPAIVSPYDTDARYSRKTRQGLAGYKIHLTETCQVPGPDGSRAAPNLITSAETTPAQVTDVAMTNPVHDTLAAAAWPPASTPSTPGMPARTNWSPPAPAGSPCSARCAPPPPARPAPAATPRTCSPSTGTASRSPAPRASPAHLARAHPQGGQPDHGPVPPGRLPALPGPGPVHHPSAPAGSSACVPAPSTKLSPPPAPPRTPGLEHRYAIRAGVEGTIWQATHVTGIRRARYTGLARTSLEHNAAAAAINLIRHDAWQTGKPLDRTRTTRLQRLGLAAGNRTQ